MKKFLFLFVGIMSLALILLSGCYGNVGNPYELTGTWEFIEKDSRDDTWEVEITKTLVITDAGKYTYTCEEEDTPTTGNKWVGEYEEEGTILGSVTNNPKTITFNRKSINTDESEQGGTTIKETDNIGDHERSYTGNYYISYVGTDTYLTIAIGSFGSSARGINTDASRTFIKK